MIQNQEIEKARYFDLHNNEKLDDLDLSSAMADLQVKVTH